MTNTKTAAVVDAPAKPKRVRKPKVAAAKVISAEEKARQDARQDATTYLGCRRIHAGRTSSLRKLRKASRIASQLRPLLFERMHNGERQVMGAHGWREPKVVAPRIQIAA